MFNYRDLISSLVLAAATATWVSAADNAKPLQGAIIMVDPGHGGQTYSMSYTGGATGVESGMTESELNLRVAFALVKILEDKGATVYMTRKADHRMSSTGWGKPRQGRTDELEARIDFFHHYNPHFWLSVHHNAGGPRNTGHTALHQMDAPDGSLYKEVAKDVNDALEGAVPGPKNRLIDRIGDSPYYLLSHTQIPGTIIESGFMTNREFDALSTKPDYPAKEAAAICKGAIKFWKDHESELVALRHKLMKERAVNPKNPNTYAAIDLNPAYQEKMKKLVAQIDPSGSHDPAKIGDYVAKFKALVVKDPKATFDIKGEYDGKAIKLSGQTSNKTYHDQLIDVLVAMNLYNISNAIKGPDGDESASPGKGKRKKKASQPKT